MFETGKPTKNEKEDLSYMEKESAGNIDFFKCKKCPYLALSTKDIKFHWQTHHTFLDSDIKKKDVQNVRIKCPGCSGIFYLESSLTVHLRSHHKMATKDIPKLVFGLIKETERKKEYIEKLDVVIGNFKSEDQIPFEGNIIPSVIEVPPDPMLNETNLQILQTNFDNDKHGEDSQILNLSNSEGVDHKECNLSSDLRWSDYNANQKAHPEVLITQGIQSGNDVLFHGNQNMINTSIQEINPLPLQTPADITDVTIKNVMGKSRRKIKNRTPKKEKAKMTKKSFPFKKKALKSSGSITNNIVERDTSDKSDYKCNIQGCRARLKLSENMVYHRSCHSNNNNEMFCAECRKQCISIESLHSHLWTQHKIDLELPSCDQCSYKTFKLSRLNNIHKKIHSDERSFTCEVCFKAFKNSKQLSNHKNSHKLSGSLKFMCNICNRELKSKRQLMKHTQVVHEKEALYHCEKCEFSAATKHTLFLHTKSHSDAKPFKCEHCVFKTSIRSSLTRHLQTHTQNKRYKCEHCNYSCIQASSLKTHLLSKHPGVPSDILHLCHFCSYKSISKANFAAHISTHSPSIIQTVIVEDYETEKCEIPDETQHISNKILSMDENNYQIKINDNDFFNSSTEGIELTSDVETEQANTVISREMFHQQSNQMVDEFSPEKCVSPISLQEVNNLYSNFSAGQRNDSIDCSIPKVSDEIIKDAFNSDVGKNEIIQEPLKLRIDLLNENTTLPNILVKPKSQICSELDSINSLNIPGFIGTRQLLHLPMHSKNNDSIINENIPRKKPKISVKSNLILKGPDNVDSFNLQQSHKSLRNDYPLLNMPFSIDDQNRSMQYQSTSNAEIIPISKLISRDPFMSDNSVLPNYLSTSNFFSTLHMPNISNNALLIQPSSDISKVQNTCNSLSAVGDTNQTSDLSEIKLENKPYIPPQSELSCTSLNDNGSGSGSLIYEIPKHTIPIKFENKAEALGPYTYQDDLFQDNVNPLNQMQNISIIEELPASFENSNGIINSQCSEIYEPYSDNLVDMLSENEIINVDDTSCEMKSIPNFAEDSNFSLAERESFYNYNVQSMQIPPISDSAESTNNRKHVKEKPRILSEVHISKDRSKIMNFAAVKNLGLKLEMPSMLNIEWTLALLNDQHDSNS